MDWHSPGRQCAPSSPSSSPCGGAAHLGALYAAAGILLLTGVAFLLGAAFVYLATQFGTVIAALSFGIVFTALGLIVLGVIHATRAKSVKQVEATNTAGAEAAKMPYPGPGSFADELREGEREHAVPLALAALAAGLATGAGAVLANRRRKGRANGHADAD